jgi:hypothetical protein
MQQMDTDYLVIGSGTAGLAFVDTLLVESDAHITIVDRHGKPGGHWNDAYPFVTLHQPSAFYGVNSMGLGSGRKDTHGLNAGLYELASGPEISGYFDRVMNHRLLPSGRVSYLPLSNHLCDGRVESLLSGRQTQINVRRKTVDARYYSPPVPSTHVPRFSVAEGVDLLPPNALPGLSARAQGREARPLPRRFVVLGAGKTAMDTCLWLLQSGADRAADGAFASARLQRCPHGLCGSALRQRRREEPPVWFRPFSAHPGRLPQEHDGGHVEPGPMGPGQGPAPMGA